MKYVGYHQHLEEKRILGTPHAFMFTSAELIVTLSVVVFFLVKLMIKEENRKKKMENDCGEGGGSLCHMM